MLVRKAYECTISLIEAEAKQVALAVPKVVCYVNAFESVEQRIALTIETC